MEKLLSQAEVLISLAPDSVIHYTDSALRLASSMSSDDPTVLRLQVIRAEALIQRKRFEEATAILEPLHYHAHEQVQEELNYRTSFLLGKAFLSTGKAKLAHTFLTEAHDLQGEALKAGELAELWAMMCELSILNGQYSKANEYLGKASHLLDSMDNQKRVPGLSRYKAICIMGSGDTTEALNVLKEALTEAIQRKDTIEWFQCLYLHASAVGRQAPELANTLFRQAFGIMESNPFQADLNRARLDLASLLHALNQNQEAIGLLRDQLETARATGDASGKLSIALRLSAILEDEGALDQALVWLDTAEQHIQHAPRTAMVYELVDRRARVLRRKGQSDKAFLSLSQSDQLIDSVSNRIRHEAAMEMDQVFRNERQGIQNDLLQSQLNREITLQRILIGTLIAISIVALILGLLLRQRRELNQHLGNAYNVLMAKYRSGQATGDVLPRMNKLSGSHPNPTGNSAEENGILERLLEYFTTEKPFLDPKFRVETAANRLQTTQKQLSQAIRHSDAGSFNTLVNRFRVEESRKLMEDPELSNYKVEFIGYKAGFGTKQTFYTAFEQHTGITPGFYRSNIQEKPAEEI